MPGRLDPGGPRANGASLRKAVLLGPPRCPDTPPTKEQGWPPGCRFTIASKHKAAASEDSSGSVRQTRNPRRWLGCPPGRGHTPDKFDTESLPSPTTPREVCAPDTRTLAHTCTTTAVSREAGRAAAAHPREHLIRPRGGTRYRPMGPRGCTLRRSLRERSQTPRAKGFHLQAVSRRGESRGPRSGYSLLGAGQEAGGWGLLQAGASFRADGNLLILTAQPWERPSSRGAAPSRR